MTSASTSTSDPAATRPARPDRRGRVRAPELVGRGGWVGTGGRPLRLSDLRGKIVVVDFWTFCCVNCLHVLDELRPLEEKYGDVLVVVGVHSPKFAHEADHDAVVAAVERYGVHHPVLDDPDLTTWSAYAVRAWPTLAVVDPEGYVVAQMSGEGHGHSLDRLVADLVAEHETGDRAGTLHRGDGPYVPPPAPETELRFPAKVLALPGGTFLVSDAGHHSLVELAADAETMLRRIGTGERGLVDGGPDEARFAEPQGLAALPAEVAATVGYDVVVADTANSALRGVTLATGAVRTVAGSGRPWRPGSGARDLSSPWDVAWLPTDAPAPTSRTRTPRTTPIPRDDHAGFGIIVVAMAGVHQLWSFDPVSGAVGVLAGTTNEGLRDGPADEAWFAQTSGLAVDPGPGDAGGPRLWLVDAETSALRSLRGGAVLTSIGHGLFDFGHRDGPAQDALLQHPLGVTLLPDGSLAVLDTYNDALRRYDPATGQVTTLATGLREPSAAVVVGTGADAQLLVVESAAHRLTRVRLPEQAVDVEARASRTRRPATQVAPGGVRLEVVFDPPSGQHLDERYGPATRLLVSATPPELLVAGAGSGSDLGRDLVVSDAVDVGVLHVAAMAASCDSDGDHPACHVHQQDWGVPVRVVAGGEDRVALVLRGLDGAR